MTAYAPSISFPGPRLVRAEMLKLRKRRGLVVTTAVLTVGATSILYTILAAVHASDASKHGPAGGIANLGYGMLLISLLGGVAAILAGVLAGSGDLGAGVFRELVVTGRSRRALFNARIPGGLAFVLPFVAVAYAITAVVSVVAAGSLAAPSVGLLVSSGVWMLLTIAFWYAVALGVASLLGSSTTSLGILLAFKLALTPVGCRAILRLLSHPAPARRPGAEDSPTHSTSFALNHRRSQSNAASGGATTRHSIFCRPSISTGWRMAGVGNDWR